MNNQTKVVDKSNYLFSKTALVALIIPLVIEQLLSVFVGMVDSMMIASVGEAAVSGVSLVDNIMILLINIFAALATGGAVVAGQYLGQKNTEQARNAAQQLVWFSGVSSIVVMLLVYALKHFILYKLFGHISDDVRSYANVYLLIVAASIPFIAIYNGGAAIFRTMGDSKVTMKISLVMNVINVIGNAIFVYGFHMQAGGVAISTLISRIVAAIIIVALLLNEEQELHLRKTLRHHFEGSMIKRILRIGVPNGMENGMFQFGKVILLSLISTFGTASITANAITGLIAYLQVLPGIAISLGTTTVISRCIGANDHEQARYYNRKLIFITYLAMWALDLIILVFLPQILRMYHLSAETAAITTKLAIWHTLGAIVIWPIAFNLPATLRAAGDVRFTMLTSIFSMWFFRLLMGYILAKYFGLGVLGVWIAMIIDWFFRSLLFSWRYLSGRWETQSVI